MSTLIGPNTVTSAERNCAPFLRCLALLYIPAQSHGWPNIDPDYSYKIEPEGAKGIIHFCVLAAHLDRQREAAMEEYNQLNRFRKVS